jgi:hypothetical protein
MTSFTHRLTRLVLGLSLAVAGGASAATVMTTVDRPVAAHAASVVGGTVPRSEVLSRAQYWVDRNVVYGTVFNSDGSVHSTATAPDPQGKSYRTDCSGLVSMAWHLDGAPTTGQFWDWPTSERLNSPDLLKAGDAVLFPGHIELFVGWKNSSNHSLGAWSYSLNGPAFNDWAKGPNPNSHGQVGTLSWNDVRSLVNTPARGADTVAGSNTLLRYSKVVDDPPPVSAPSIDAQGGHLVDFDGDGRPDIVGTDATGDQLWVVPNTSGVGSPARGQSVEMSGGWKTVTRYWLEDYDGDGKADILGLNGTDQLMVWLNTSTPGHPSTSAFVSLGAQWSTLTNLVFADFTGDGKIDIGGWDSTNREEFWVVPNTSSPGHASRGTSMFVSDGWGTVTRTWVADYDSDGKTDLLGLNGTDELFVWRNTGSGGVPSFAPLVSLGTAWNTLTDLIVGDFTGDGKPDIAGRDAVSSDQLWVVPNTSVVGSPSRGQSVHVSDGWGTVSPYLAADFDGDGKTDLLGFNGADSLLAWRGVPANGTPAFAAYAQLGTGWHTIGHILTQQ